MRRLLPGAMLFLASIALPATFHGTVYLAAVWLAIALVGLYLIATSSPVKPRLVGWVRRELGVEPTGQGASPIALPSGLPGHDPERALRRAITAILEELEYTHDKVNEAIEGRAWWRNIVLSANQWQAHGELVAMEGHLDSHERARRAYLLIDKVNHRHDQAWNRSGKDYGERPPYVSDGDIRLLAEAEAEITEAESGLNAALP